MASGNGGGGGKGDAFHAKLEAKLLESPKLASFVNLSTKWGCQASDTTLRKPLLVLSFILVLGSVVTQKFAFIGLLYGNAEAFPWTKADIPASTLWALLSNVSNYTGGPFEILGGGEGNMDWQYVEHELLAIAIASKENPMDLALVSSRQSLIEVCFYPKGPGWAAGGEKPIDLAGKSYCLPIEQVAAAVGGGYQSCYQSTTSMYACVCLGLIFGFFGLIDTFSRWEKFKKGEPNDRGHFKCLGVFIFVLTFFIDLISFINYQANCIGPLDKNEGGGSTSRVTNVEWGLGYIMLYIQFGLNHGANLIKTLIPAIDLRELAANGGAETSYFGMVVKPAGSVSKPGAAADDKDKASPDVGKSSC